MITRQQYMNHEATHREYYAQFVTPAMRRAVERVFGIERLLASEDEHLNDVGTLRQWDRLAYAVPIEQIRESGDVNAGAPSNVVCVAKEAAKQLIEEAV